VAPMDQEEAEELLGLANGKGDGGVIEEDPQGPERLDRQHVMSSLSHEQA